jgi:hypothetical protein
VGGVVVAGCIEALPTNIRRPPGERKWQARCEASKDEVVFCHIIKSN